MSALEGEDVLGTDGHEDGEEQPPSAVGVVE